MSQWGKKKGKKKVEILMNSRLKNQSQPKQQNRLYKNVTLSPMLVFSKLKGTKIYLFYRIAELREPLESITECSSFALVFHLPFMFC